ncbi:MAG: LysR family transcriptional regulator [Pelosinus sp.]|nr:LysR family transcriptional regulator [Pelosinus sp.]
MEERDWLILKVLYEQKNITKTAQSLYISQPALTARLRQIEDEFGVKVAYRTTKGVHFTAEGEFLVNSAQDVLQNYRKIKDDVLSLGDRVAGTLRIGASSYFTMYMLPKLLRRFGQSYPDVEFKVVTTWSREIFNLMHNQEIHVGFISSDYGWANQKHVLFEEEICIVSRNEFDFKELPKLPRINYQSDGLIKTMIDKWWRDNFAEPPFVSMEVDKLATCKEMVMNGLGYAIMPSLIMSDQSKVYKSILYDKDGCPLRRSSSMIYYHELLGINVVKAFTGFVESLNARNMFFPSK